MRRTNAKDGYRSASALAVGSNLYEDPDELMSVVRHDAGGNERSLWNNAIEGPSLPVTGARTKVRSFVTLDEKVSDLVLDGGYENTGSSEITWWSGLGNGLLLSTKKTEDSSRIISTENPEVVLRRGKELYVWAEYYRADASGDQRYEAGVRLGLTEDLMDFTDPAESQNYFANVTDMAYIGTNMIWVEERVSTYGAGYVRDNAGHGLQPLDSDIADDKYTLSERNRPEMLGFHYDGANTIYYYKEGYPIAVYEVIDEDLDYLVDKEWHVTFGVTKDGYLNDTCYVVLTSISWLEDE